MPETEADLLREARLIAQLESHAGYQVLVKRVSSEERSRLVRLNEARYQDDPSLAGATREWLAFRDAVLYLKELPNNCKKELEDLGADLY